MNCWNGHTIGLDQGEGQAGGDERITALERSILGSEENSREFAGRQGMFPNWLLVMRQLGGVEANCVAAPRCR